MDDLGVGTDLVRALLNELDPDEWVPRYAVVLLDAVDERDKRIKEVEKEIVRLKEILSENWDTMQADITQEQYWRKCIKDLRAELQEALDHDCRRPHR